MKNVIAVLRFALASSILVALFQPHPALAWGNTGHEAVAFIAWQNMSPEAQAQAIGLIRRVPQLTTPKGNKVDGSDQWLSELPAGLSMADQNLFLFMRAATWADSIKHVGFQDSDDPPPGVSMDLPIGFTDPASHGYWHFVDNNLNLAAPAPVPNAAVQITVLRQHLISDADPQLKAYELAWLLHLVGDIHQPLHGVRRFVADKSDLGGNSVKISLSPSLKQKFLANRPQGAHGNPPTNLHSFWDDLPGVMTDPTVSLMPAADFAKALQGANSSDVNDTDPANWAQDSFQIAMRDGYVSPIGPGNTTAAGHGFVMTNAYYDQALSDAKTRVALAGARLAKMLNDIWPADGASK
jgi:hypothetical protein